jgi:hypothetical protein
MSLPLIIAAATLLFIIAPTTTAHSHSLRVGTEHLFPTSMHARTRAAHRFEISQWHAPVRNAASPVLFPTNYGADPTGTTDSSPAFALVLSALLARATGKNMSDGIADLGGVVVDLQGGEYLLSAPFALPQFLGNLRIIDGTLRASPLFPPSRFIIEVGASPCRTPSGQGSCNENVGMSGLTLDGSHIAAGCLKISATMGATLDSSSAIFGFVSTGVLLEGGHESMIAETWVAAYFWSDPRKESNDAVGISVAGNDHFVSNTIVFSARIGVDLSGAANKLTNVHTWNCATGNGGTGILNRESQNIFIGIYMDFTDLVLRNSQQISVTNGFFLGGAQIIFESQKANDTVLGVSILSNVWYDCSGPSLAVNETGGTFFSNIADLDVIGTSFCGYSKSKAIGLPIATKVLTTSNPVAGLISFDFTDVLLFPSAGIASAQVSSINTSSTSFTTIKSVPSAGEPLTVALYTAGNYNNAQYIVTVDQSARSSWSVQV